LSQSSGRIGNCARRFAETTRWEPEQSAASTPAGSSADPRSKRVGSAHIGRHPLDIAVAAHREARGPGMDGIHQLHMVEALRKFTKRDIVEQARAKHDDDTSTREPTHCLPECRAGPLQMG